MKQLRQQSSHLRQLQKPIGEKLQQKLIESQRKDRSPLKSPKKTSGELLRQAQEDEYGSIGRQDKDLRFYQNMRASPGSEEISDDFQVAEEDVGSFIKHRNAYLDDEI